MRGIKLSLLLASTAVVGFALWAGAYVEQTGSRMATAASRFLASLSKPQAEKTTFTYESLERLNWHFIPRGARAFRSRSSAPSSVPWPSA